MIKRIAARAVALVLGALSFQTGLSAQQNERLSLWESVTTTNRGDDMPRVVWKQVAIHQREFSAACKESAHGMSDATLKEWSTGLLSQPGVASFGPVDHTSIALRIVYRGGTRRVFDWLCLPTDVDPRFPVVPPR